MNINKVFLMGNLTRDPEFRQTPTGQSVCTVAMATNSFFTSRSGERQKKAEFHTVILWGRQAEIANQFLRRGSSVFIEGRLQTRAWTDKEGKNRKTTEVVAERMQLGPRGSGAQDGGTDSFNKDSEPAFSADEDPKDDVFPEINIDEEIKSEDIPF